MDQSLDFSFHKGNPLALADDIESPKPMPSPPVLPVAPADEDTEIPSGQPDKPASSPAVALDVLESLRISPATPVSNEDNAICEASTSLQPITKIAAPIPKLPEEHVSSPKAKPRAKIPYEKGFTQMDWLKRTRTEPDLAGLKGGTNRRLIPLSEVKQHKKEDDAWTVLKGRVYNISPYLKFHPGGVDMLMKGAGKDCTTLFSIL